LLAVRNAMQDEYLSVAKEVWVWSQLLARQYHITFSVKCVQDHSGCYPNWGVVIPQ